MINIVCSCFLFTVFLYMSTAVQAQSLVYEENNWQHNPEYWATRAKNTRKSAKILLYAGGAGIATGSALFFTSDRKAMQSIDLLKSSFGLMLMTGGTLSSLTSVPFYVVSAKQQQKALSLHPSVTVIPDPQGLTSVTYPVVSLKWSF